VCVCVCVVALDHKLVYFIKQVNTGRA
jgi:hypothetical protein